VGIECDEGRYHLYLGAVIAQKSPVGLSLARLNSVISSINFGFKGLPERRQETKDCVR
jgi:hypothetical protein